MATEAAAKAELAKAQAAATQATADYRRNLTLSKEGIISAQAMDVAKATAESNAAAVQSAQSQVKQATAQVAMQKAALTVAQTNLEHTVGYWKNWASCANSSGRPSLLDLLPCWAAAVQACLLIAPPRWKS